MPPPLLLQVEFWHEMQTPHPNLNQLYHLSSDMSLFIDRAEAAFTHLLTINSSSVAVLRSYAAFNLSALNDPAKATTLVAEADRIEEQQAKDAERNIQGTTRMLDIVDLDVSGDSTGLIIIGGTPSNLGMILSANASACRIYGLARWEMERRNVSTLIPAPFAEMHDKWLRSCE